MVTRLSRSCSHRAGESRAGYTYGEVIRIMHTMPLDKIPAILLSGIGTYTSLTTPTPLTPKNERRMGDLMNANRVVWFMKASDFAIRILNIPK